MAKVYITNKGAHDFSPAADYGDFVYLSKGSINRYATNRMYRMFMDAMEDSDPGDYLLPTSLSTMNLIAAAIFVMKHHRLNLLLFKDGRYVERSLIFDDIEDSSLSGALSSTAAKALLKG